MRWVSNSYVYASVLEALRVSEECGGGAVYKNALPVTSCNAEIALCCNRRGA